MKFGQFVATQESLGVESVTDMELAQTSTELAEEASAMTSEGGVIIKTDDAISDAFTAVDHLSEATEVLSKDTGDLSPQIVAAMESLYSTIMTGLGMSEDRVTMESNGDNRAAWIATMEDKKEGLLIKIYRAVAAVLTTALGFIGRIFNNIRLIRLQLNNLRTRVYDSDNFKGGGKLKAGFADYDDADAGIKAASECLSHVYGHNEFLADAKDELEGGDREDLDSSNVDGLVNDLNKSIGEIPTSGFCNGSKIEIDKTGKLHRISFVKGSGEKDAEGLSKKEAMSLLTRAHDIAYHLTNMKKTENIIQHTVKRIQTFISNKWNEYRAKSSNAEVADKAKRQLISNSLLSLIRTATRNLTVVVPIVVIDTVRTIIKYVSESLKIKGLSNDSKVDKANLAFKKEMDALKSGTDKKLEEN